MKICSAVELGDVFMVTKFKFENMLYMDESDGLDGRMIDCINNCCRDVGSYFMWLVLSIILVTTAVCDALLGLVPHFRVRSMVFKH